ncbi:MAG: hypothetical protein Kow00127_17020 [Bacteroidales bacterium]
MGYNDRWIELGSKRDVTFTNLDPGSYRLLVRGSNNNGVWNNTGTALDIRITPPWWRTRQAYLAYMLLFLGSLFLVHKIQRNRVVKKTQQKANQREAELIKHQAEELKTIDRLVRVINQAGNLEDLFKSLLQQTMSILPKAEKAAVFLRDKQDGLFRVAFTEGYRIKDLESVSFTYEDLMKRYSTNSVEAEKGIFIIRNAENLFGSEKLTGFEQAKSMLVMAVNQGDITEAFVVFDNFTDVNAFESGAANLLSRFREHAVSAISKAQAIKSLQEKNEKIIRTQTQLIHAEKMASLGELAAGISHEIQNPLNFVNNFSEVSADLLAELQEELEKGDIDEANSIASDLIQNLGKIIHHGKRASNIVRGMLEHSRGSTSEKNETDLNALADEYLRLAYHGIRARNHSFPASYKFIPDTSLPKIRVVAQDIGRVLLNLINNAFYAVFEKTKSAAGGYHPEVMVLTRHLTDRIELRVRDNGMGIPDSLKKKIFQPFYTTKPSGEGTGLGLSLSFDIITKGHGGNLKVESIAGKGTDIIIELPVN